MPRKAISNMSPYIPRNVVPTVECPVTFLEMSVIV